MRRTHHIASGSSGHHVCGCYVFNPNVRKRTYLPQVKLDIHTTILSKASRTVLRQTFVNGLSEPLQEIRYAFPLFDGVSVVEFFCQIGERTIYGLVKEKSEARKTYEDAKQRGESAALFEQLPEAADVFTTAISNIPKDSSVNITIKYVQELRHDAEVDGVRLTIPTLISPRYGTYPRNVQDTSANLDAKGVAITIDVNMATCTPIKKVISPSHPIEVTLGTLSTSTNDEKVSAHKASATLSLRTTKLEKDFVLQVVAKDVGIPQAILEKHPTLPDQRALMTTLVPKFNLKSQKPEIIFIVDRSGSMEDQIGTLVSALKVFLKSIPVGCMFNICSFGSYYKFLWPKSQVYGKDTLDEAISYVDTFEANFGGTETLNAVRACCEARQKELPTELMLLTDGDIWSQQEMFDYISEQTKSGDIRVFPIGIGGGVSSALIEGVARAGRGFAQMVADNEKLDSKIVRMLKGALTPHIKDYRLEVKYEDESVESVADSLRVRLSISDEDGEKTGAAQADEKPISLYDSDFKEEHPKASEPKDIFAGLPHLDPPKLLQTPHEIPPLFPFNRTCVYLLLAPESLHLKPKSVILRGTSPQGPLEVELPVEVREEADEMIHQLAARKATQELEEGHGWLSEASVGDTSVLVKEKHPAQFTLLQRREAVRLGVQFQVGGKYCSFVAVEANEAEIVRKRSNALNAAIHRNSGNKEDDWEMVEQDESDFPAGNETHHPKLSRSSGGTAPPRQLASKPYCMSAPSGEMIGSSSSLFAHGMGKGGAMRHRKISMDTAADFKEEEEYDGECDKGDIGFGLFDGPPSVSQTFPADRHASQKPKTETSGFLVERLIACQSFEGSWPAIGDDLCRDLMIEREATSNAVEELVKHKHAPDQKTIEQVLSTAIVVVFLENKMTSEEETWELVVDKARTWLDDATSEGFLAEVWRVAAEIVGV
ncbi:von Willebrand domain-containing protein [Decorospora gaudefroyi]|uniref:von Willebrand domain-containing protein n=1 Tax=Decorospora gaudefroyi TaxID=184978 RepID=A0A6A5K1Y4_9PLEO|nr:von Willebrand domain-containing protein [Decorospora gaudefroyi]